MTIRPKTRMASRLSLACEIILAIVLPPLGVFFRFGLCTTEFLICLLLTILGYLPGIIYALYAIVFMERKEPEGGGGGGDHYHPVADV